MKRGARSFTRGAYGFSLVEVLVALVVISIGLLGIAKMHALAYSSTATASQRSLAAIEASSLASAMHANRAYWSTGSAPATITVATTSTTTTVISTDSTLTTTPTCTSTTAACTAAQIAAYDLQNWAASLRALLPNAGSIINCPANPIPVTCSIVVVWNEKTVAINKQANTTLQTTSYQLFVEP